MESREGAVGDAGASWRLKAIKRARERAEREGKDVSKELEERFGDVGSVLQGAAATRAAPQNAHMHASKKRKHGEDPVDRYSDVGKGQAGKMRKPSNPSNLAWGKSHRPEQSRELQAAAKTMNKYASDGSFMERLRNQRDDLSKATDAKEGTQSKSSTTYQEAGNHTKTTGASNSSQAVTNDTKAGGGNIGAAAALRAKLSGNPKAANDVRDACKTEEASEKEVHLPAVRADGKPAPGAFGRQAGVSGKAESELSERKEGKIERFGKDGKRERYFRDDEGRSLKDLVAEQKLEGEPDVDERMAQNIVKKGSSFKSSELDAEEEYDNDVGLHLAEQPGRRQSEKRRAKKEKEEAKNDYKRLTTVSERCKFCFQNPSKPRHLHIAYGARSYLSLPIASPFLVERQCIIAIMDHSPSMRMADEDAQTDVRNFKKSLVRMFSSLNQECLFIETATGIQKMAHHACIECFPVPQGTLDDAPAYFKKALMEEEGDWSTHAAKSVISTGSKVRLFISNPHSFIPFLSSPRPRCTQGLNRSIPAHFPYFHVEFGLSEGYVHVIEEEANWDMRFGHKMVAGLLGMSEHEAVGKGGLSRERAGEQLASFLTAWRPFDWTEELE